MSDDVKVLPPEQNVPPGPGAPAGASVGVDHPRVETTEKLTGDALYTGDLLLPGMLHAKVKKSPHARARILGIDTSLGTSVAVVEPDGVVRSQFESTDPRGHAEVIGSMIERALAEASVRPADITHVATGMGPGPFTGLRVGIAAARAFALGRGIPVIPVVSHDAVALDALLHAALMGELEDAERFAVVTDARRRV